MKAIKTSPTESETSQPFEKFERLAKGLMAVPKKELDAKQAEYEREKKRNKKRKEKG
jgi:hypothetical protein